MNQEKKKKILLLQCFLTIVHAYRKNKNNKAPCPFHFSITFQGSTATDNQRKQKHNWVLTSAHTVDSNSTPLILVVEGQDNN